MQQAIQVGDIPEASLWMLNSPLCYLVGLCFKHLLYAYSNIISSSGTMTQASFLFSIYISAVYVHLKIQCIFLAVFTMKPFQTYTDILYLY